MKRKNLFFPTERFGIILLLMIRDQAMTKLDNTLRDTLKYSFQLSSLMLMRRMILWPRYALFFTLSFSSVNSLSLMFPRIYTARSPKSSRRRRGNVKDDSAATLKNNLSPASRVEAISSFFCLRQNQRIYSTHRHEEEIPLDPARSNSTICTSIPFNLTTPSLTPEKSSSLLKNNQAESYDQKLELWTHQLISCHLPGLMTKEEAASWMQEVRFAMKAWSRKRSKQGAISIEMLLKRIIDERKAGNEQVKLSTSIYNVVLHGWAMSGAIGAAQRAEQIVSLMISSSDPNVAPNVKSYSTLIHAWARSSEPGAARRAELILDYMEANSSNIKPNTVSYNTVIAAWARSNDIDAPARAEKILDRMQRLHESGDGSVIPDARSFTALMKSLARCRDPTFAVHKAEEILKKMKSLYAQGDLNAKPSIFTYATVIQILSRSSEPGAAERALSLLEEILSSDDDDMKPNAIMFNSVIRAFARNRELGSAQKAENLLRRMEKMKASEVRPNVQSYIQVIQGYSRSDEEDGAIRAAQVHDRMTKLYKQGNVDAKPTVASFNEVIEAWAYKGNPKMAEQTFSEMQQMYMQGNIECMPNTNSFAALMEAWGTISGENDGPRRAEQLLLYIEELYDGGNLNARPDLRCYTSVIEALARSGMDASAQQAEGVLLRMIDRHERLGEVKPDARCFSSVIDGYSRSGETGACCKAERLLKVMDVMDVKPDVFSFSTVIGALSRSGENGAAEKAEAILHWMEELSSAGNVELRPNTITYSGVIKAWSKSRVSGAAQKAESILNRMMMLHDTGLSDAKVDAICFTSVINAWSKCNQKGAAKKAEDLLIRMKRLHEEGNPDLKPDSIAYNTVIAAWSWELDEKGAKKAEEYVYAMEDLYSAGDESIKPSTFSYNQVIHGYCRRGHPSMAESLLSRMEELFESGRDDVHPNSKTFPPLIKAFADKNNFEGAEGAERILMKMIHMHAKDGNAEVKPTAQLFYTVINALSKVGSPEALDRAEKMLMKMADSIGCADSDMKTQLYSFASVINTYSRMPDRRKGSQKADQLLSQMLKLSGAGSAGSIPFSIAFSSVINAHCRSSEPSSAKRIEYLLGEMEKLNKSLAVRASTVNYNYAIHAHTKMRDPGAAHRADKMLTRMEELYRFGCKDSGPNIVSYNMVLNAWAREASSKWAKDGSEAGFKSVNLLGRMEKHGVQADILSYTACIKSLSRCVEKGSPQLAESILDRVESRYNAGESRLKPDCKLYTAVINCWAHSDEPEKASQAYRVLHRMLDAYTSGNAVSKPDLYAYNSVILACATSKGSSEDKKKAMKIAFQTFRKIKVTEGYQPDEFAYTRFLKACNNLLTYDNKSRSKIVDAVFRRCCKDGQVSVTVLREMKRAPPSSTRIANLEIVGLPYEWSRNVRDKKGLHKSRDC